MIRTRLAQAAAVATLAVGTVLLLPIAASAAPTAQSAVTASAALTTGTPDNGTWG